MKKLKLIIAREYMSMLGRKSFIVMTILMPVLMIVLIAIPALIAYLNDAGSDQEKVAIIDETGHYGAAIPDSELYQFIPLASQGSADKAHEFYKSAGDLSAVVIIPRDVDSTAQVSIYSENTINVGLKNYVERSLSDTLTRARVASYDVPGLQKIINESSVNVDIKSVKWTDKGDETESSTEMAMILGMVLAMLTYMFVLMYGAMIMNGVIEEKTNRIVEVIVSSCKPFELMMGKIIGVGLVGLTQMAVWVVIMGGISMVAGSLFGVSAIADPTSAITAAQAGLETDGDTMAKIMSAIMGVDYGRILTCFVLYFVGGYLLYAALFAAFGSAVDQASDASQFTTPIILIMVVALYAGIACVENPNGPMAMWCSMIPFTSPIVMMVRLPYDVPLWQLALSIVLLFATAAAMVWLAARIYRTGILLYGKKTSFKEILRWMKR